MSLFHKPYHYFILLRLVQAGPQKRICFYFCLFQILLFFLFVSFNRRLEMRKYRLVAKKGEGTFSEVLKAQNVKDGKYHAIKCMKNRFDTIDQVMQTSVYTFSSWFILGLINTCLYYLPLNRLITYEKFRLYDVSPPMNT